MGESQRYQCYSAMLSDRRLLSHKKLHPEADGIRCRDAQPNNRQTLGSLVEEWEGRIEGDGGGC